MSREIQHQIRNVRSLGERFAPDEAWVRATRETLLMQARNSMPQEPVHPVAHVGHLWRSFVPSEFVAWLRGPVIATLSILMVALGGSVASVSAAERSLPGDFLYSLKLATEQARLAFTSTKEDKLKLKVEFTTRRADDLKTVASTDSPSKPERVVQAAEILKRDLNTVKQQLTDMQSDVSPTKAVEIAKLVDTTSNQVVQSLQDTKASLPLETQDKVIEAQAAAADTSVKAIEVIVQKHQESSDIPASDVVQAIQDHTKTITDVALDSGVNTTSTSLVNVSSSSSLALATASTSTASLDKVVQDIRTATLEVFASQTSSVQAVLAASGSSTSMTDEGSSTTSIILVPPNTSDTSTPATTPSSTQTTPP